MRLGVKANLRPARDDDRQHETGNVFVGLEVSLQVIQRPGFGSQGRDTHQRGADSPGRASAGRFCLEAAGDPKAEWLREHHCLFGKPEQSPRIYHGGFPSLMPVLALPPLSWFDHPKAHERPTHRPDETHTGLDLMPARHMAGVRDRPSAEETSAILRKPDLDSTEQTMTYNLFACITPDDLFRLLLGEGLTLFEIVRALHNSGVKKYSLRRRLEQFAVRTVLPYGCVLTTRPLKRRLCRPARYRIRALGGSGALPRSVTNSLSHGPPGRLANPSDPRCSRTQAD